ncbi:MAG TPA: hypothetical protein VKH19_11630 [Gemmatimonadaceae bacterium]|nr:hypothetical protein [Gemmatimonadaceae bacterium]
MKLPAIAAVSLAAMLAGGGCSDSTSVTDLVGLYSATQFTVAESGSTTDWLQGGATLQLILNANQTTAGTLFIPGGNDDGSDLTADLTGTWTVDDGKVLFDQPVDTFIRNMAFTVSGNTLIGDETFGTARVRLTLTRQNFD